MPGPENSHCASATRIALFCLAALVSAEASAGEKAAHIPVAGVRAKEACVREDVRITGFAAAREASGASLSTPGLRITEILVAEGDRVSANQELLHAVREGGGETGAAAAGAKSGVVTLRSPISGVIVKVNARIGDVSGAPSAAAQAMAAQAGPPEPQIEISAGPAVDLIADVPSIYASQIRKGAIARIENDEGVAAKGVVQAPASEVDPTSQLGRARLSVEPSSALRPGQFASATIETAQDCGVTVPLSAVSHHGASTTVMVLQGSSLEKRPIHVGRSDQTKVRVRDGLAEGEIVAIHADMSLRHGDAVAPTLIDAREEAN